MARNYMQDIDTPEDPEPHMMPERSIRNIQPTSRPRPMRAVPPQRPHAPRKKRGRWGIWLAALIALLALGGAGALILYPSTTIEITPHTQTVPFDMMTEFTAYPGPNAGTSVISYTVVSERFEDSAVVPASGIESVEEQATGVITIYNNYSEEPVRLIRNTRFETPNGLIFRIPASVDVPGRSGDTPGSIETTVFADQYGEEYNIPPVDRFTLPGLSSSPDMFERVYARSTAAFTGGFVGERPAVAPATLEAARSELRGRLNERAQQLMQTAPEGTLSFPGLTQVRYETLPPTSEPGGSVRIHERAIVSIPVFPADAFAQSIARSVSASSEGQSISIRFADNVSAALSEAPDEGSLGEEPILFSISGTGQLVWNVDTEELTTALAGREESAFQVIIQNFPAVEEARARITPFWKRQFPSDPAKIKVVVQDPPRPF